MRARPAAGQEEPSSANAGVSFAFLAETSRCLAGSLDVETTLATGAGLALPHFGTWCMVDIVEADESIRRVAVIHPDPEKQRLAREFYGAHPPSRDDALGAGRVIRTRESDFVLAYDEVLEGITEDEHRSLLRDLGAQSFLMVPMSARGRTLGAITFVSDDRRRYDEADLLLAEDLGRRCAMAVDNARLYAASEAACRVATLTAQRAEQLLDEVNVARHEAAEADSARTAFLGTISHEFRTPLTAVQGFADLLTEEDAGPLNEAQRHQVERIRRASDHLLGLIGEILEFAGQQSGRSTLRLREMDAAEAVREAASLVEPLATAKGLAFPVRIADGPVLMRTDPGKFRQIILNLAANAVKFTDQGEVRLEMAASDGSVVLRVEDTGIGIPPEHAEHVFTPFWQLDQSSTRAGGTGLGLPVARQLAKLLGGELTMESEAGGGSIFTVRLPRDPESLPEQDPNGPKSLDVREQRTKGRREKNRRGAKASVEAPQGS